MCVFMCVHVWFLCSLTLPTYPFPPLPSPPLLSARLSACLPGECAVSCDPMITQNKRKLILIVWATIWPFFSFFSFFPINFTRLSCGDCIPMGNKRALSTALVHIVWVGVRSMYPNIQAPILYGLSDTHRYNWLCLFSDLCVWALLTSYLLLVSGSNSGKIERHRARATGGFEQASKQSVDQSLNPPSPSLPTLDVTCPSKFSVRK